MPTQLHSYTDGDQLADELSRAIAEGLQNAIRKNTLASLAVSGGTTPLAMFQMLSKINIPWQQVRVTLVDERWLNDTHPDANARLVKAHLLQNKAAAAQWFSLKTEHEHPTAAIDDLNHRLSPLLPFDVVILGMGADGHTASFFPDAKALQQALSPAENQLCAAIESPTANYPRITIVLPLILQARQVFLHIIGEKKRAVLDSAMQAGEVSELPVRAVLHQDIVPVDIYYAEE